MTDARLTRRQEAAEIMRGYIQEEGVIQFLLKSFQEGEWLFNVPVLWEQYENIVGWQEVTPYQGPAMFIKVAHRPTSKIFIAPPLRASFLMLKLTWSRYGPLAACGKPELVLRTLHRFLDSDE